MAKLAKLTQISDDELTNLIIGYTSSQKYVVTRHESDEITEINLMLVDLPEPYVRRWQDDDDFYPHYQEVLKSGHSFGLWDGQKLIGIAICELRAWNNSLWVWEFHVDPKYQGQGLGRKLMSALINHAKEQDCRIIVCETQNTNLPAIRFYRKMGFRLDGLDITYYTNDESAEFALMMKCPLE